MRALSWEMLLISQIPRKLLAFTGPRIAVCKIAWNHGWSNGPPMMVLWVVLSILGGPLKIRVNFKSLHRWHMDFRVFFLWGLHTILLEIDFKQIKHHGKLWLPLVTKSLGRPTNHLGGPLGRPDELQVALGDRATFYFTHWDRFWSDFADIKHDYTQEFYRSYSYFISQCPRTGKFRGVLGCNCIQQYVPAHKNQFAHFFIPQTNKVRGGYAGFTFFFFTHLCPGMQLN